MFHSLTPRVGMFAWQSGPYPTPLLCNPPTQNAPQNRPNALKRFLAWDQPSIPDTPSTAGSRLSKPTKNAKQKSVLAHSVPHERGLAGGRNPPRQRIRLFWFTSGLQPCPGGHGDQRTGAQVGEAAHGKSIAITAHWSALIAQTRCTRQDVVR